MLDIPLVFALTFSKAVLTEHLIINERNALLHFQEEEPLEIMKFAFLVLPLSLTPCEACMSHDFSGSQM